MAELSAAEKLQPSLLDRLTDDEPQKKSEPRDRRVLPVEKLRDSVRRDLAWLLNTASLSSYQDLTPYPEVVHSTVNFGMPDLTGRTASTIQVPEVVAALRQAILDFEPRLTPGTVKVDAVVAEDEMSANTLAFDIQADLWSQPLPVRLYLRSDVNLEDGEVRITEKSIT